MIYFPCMSSQGKDNPLHRSQPEFWSLLCRMDVFLSDRVAKHPKEQRQNIKH